MSYDFDIEVKLAQFKDNLLKSKKYWIIFLIILLFASLYQWNLHNYLNPSIIILITTVSALGGIFTIAFYFGHKTDKQLYKTAFIIIITFGILSCVITPICYTPDEVEHFVRSEMTSNGVLIPEYNNGSYLTIQSTIDLIEDSRNTWDTGFDHIDMVNSSIMHTDADTKPINNTLVKYPSAFAQNPFYGYLPQAIGMAIAKLLDLNVIWLLWLGRIFNLLTYSILALIAIKKSPILKIPLTVLACSPLTIFISSSLSIDAMINGLSILAISYFFFLYASPKHSLNEKHILKFSLIILLLGLCKVTCFALILLLFALPRENFKNNKYRIKALISLFILGTIAMIWTKYYADPGFYASFRGPHHIASHVNSTEQLTFLFNHPTDAIITIFQLPRYLKDWYFMDSPIFNIIYVAFIGSIILLYPHPKFNLKSRIITFVTGGIYYVGTYITFLLSWTKVGVLDAISGVQTRYFIPLLILLPFIFGINHANDEKDEIDSYVITISISFLALQLMWYACKVYS